jgi:hypothetical protein
MILPSASELVQSRGQDEERFCAQKEGFRRAYAQFGATLVAGVNLVATTLLRESILWRAAVMKCTSLDAE